MATVLSLVFLLSLQTVFQIHKQNATLSISLPLKDKYKSPQHVNGCALPSGRVQIPQHGLITPPPSYLLLSYRRNCRTADKFNALLPWPLPINVTSHSGALCKDLDPGGPSTPWLLVLITAPITLLSGPLARISSTGSINSLMSGIVSDWLQHPAPCLAQSKCWMHLKDESALLPRAMGTMKKPNQALEVIAD